MQEIESHFQIYKFYVLKFFRTMSTFIFQANGNVYVFVGANFEGLNVGFEIQKVAGMQRTYSTIATPFFENKISNYFF